MRGDTDDRAENGSNAPTDCLTRSGSLSAEGDLVLPYQTYETHIHRSFLDRGHDTQQHQTADIHATTLQIINTNQGSDKSLLESLPLDRCCPNHVSP